MKPLATLAAAMAIALATAAPAQAGMQLSKILPFPGVVPGGQNVQVNAEWIVVKNTAFRAKNLRGWFIREKKGNRTYTFPRFTLLRWLQGEDPLGRRHEHRHGPLLGPVEAGVGRQRRPRRPAPGLGPRAGQVRLPGRDGSSAAANPRQGLQLLRGPAQAAGSGGLTWSTSRSIVGPSG